MATFGGLVNTSMTKSRMRNWMVLRTSAQKWCPCGPGEVLEFKAELHSSDKHKRKDTVKKVIAAMTVGKDVSMLFPDVVNCMQVSRFKSFC